MIIFSIKKGRSQKGGMPQTGGLRNFFGDASKSQKNFACDGLTFTHIVVYLYFIYLYLFVLAYTSTIPEKKVTVW